MADLFSHNSTTMTASCALLSFPCSCVGTSLVMEDDKGSSSSARSKAGSGFMLIGNEYVRSHAGAWERGVT